MFDIEKAKEFFTEEFAGADNETFVRLLSPYFTDYEADLLRPLEKAKHELLLILIDLAIREHPEEPVFWFWQGWALQFFAPDSGYDTAHVQPHPHFEWIEHAYKRVLELNEDRIEARFMLTYLHWDHAQRFRVAASHTLVEQPSAPIGTQSVDFAAAREQWELLEFWEFEHIIWLERWRFYPVEMPTLATLIERIMPDIIDSSYHTLLYRDIGMGWEAYAAGKPDSERLVAFANARRAYAQGAKSGPSKDNWDWEFYINCIVALVVNNTAAYGGDLDDGVRALRQLAEALKDYNRRHSKLAWLDQTDEVLDFVLSHSDLVTVPGVAEAIQDIQASLETKCIEDWQSNVRLNWFLGRSFLHRGDWQTALPFLAAAHKSSPNDGALITEYALALINAERTHEAAIILHRLPGKTDTEQLMRRMGDELAIQGRILNQLSALPKAIEELKGQVHRVYGLVSDLGENLTNSLRNYEMPTVTQTTGDEQESDRMATKIADQVSMQFAEMLHDQTTLYSNIRQKCENDFYGIWDVLPSELQEEVVTAETMHQLFYEYALQQNAALIIQWGKLAEAMLRIGVLMPAAAYLDENNYSNGLELDFSIPSKRTRKETLTRQSGSSWRREFERMELNRAIGLLNAVERTGETHVLYRYLSSQISEKGLRAWLAKVPKQLDAIRRLRNNAVHTTEQYYLTHALEARSILVTYGLLVDLALPLKASATKR